MNISILRELPDSAVLRLPQVLALTSLSKTHIRTLERRGDFPPRFRLGERAVAWRAGDVRRWIDARAGTAIDPADCRFGTPPDVVRKQRDGKDHEAPMVTRGNRFPTPARKASTATGGK